MTLLSLGVWLGVVALAWCFYVAVQIVADRLYPDPEDDPWLEQTDERLFNPNLDSFWDPADYRTVFARIRDRL